ncbi:SGNH/GDSL hydrolase family protein [Streptomyces sp. NPDC000594]|uniref:SGNH/GDSL hydrolase family protein n=1 Tax=Streptomyces sp. NPDC000594 TaxID=3154261 RepID=UPI0033206A36
MRNHQGTVWLGTALLIGALGLPAQSALATDGPAPGPGARTVAGDSTAVGGRTAAPVPEPRAAAEAEEVITFSEFPEDTAVTRQYKQRGIVFSGGGGGTPSITTDTASPTTPVLSGSPRFQGAVEGRFVKMDGTGRTVTRFSLDVGYIDNPGSVSVIVHDLKGKELTRKPADRNGIVRIAVTGKGIASFRVQQTSPEGSGFAVDNVRFPRPTVLAALGDSFSSGEANPPYVAGTDIDGKGCHRSLKAWPVTLGKNNKAVDSVEHFACSGALTTALTQEFKKEIPQLTALGRLTGAKEPRVVTLSLGGNDVGFSTILESCFVPGGTCLGKGGAVENGEKELLRLSGTLKGHYESIQKKAPNATVVVVGYPRLFPATDEEEDCSWLSNKERIALNALGTKLDFVLAARAKQAGVEYVSVQETMSGHELCTVNESWFWPVGLTGGQQRAHPLEKGQKAIEAKVRKHIDTLLKS